MQYNFKMLLLHNIYYNNVILNCKLITSAVNTQYSKVLLFFLHYLKSSVINLSPNNNLNYLLRY